jgi:mono/diheme cytochrome c family protein
MKFVRLGLVVSLIASATAAHAADPLVERGKYLSTVTGCTDCHTPGHLFGKPDMTRFLGGSDVGFSVPHLGVFVGPNLTSDRETGLGGWTRAQIIAAITTGMRPDGRELAPVMPWRGFAHLTAGDAEAIAAFLQSLPPVANKVPGPFGAQEAATVFVMSAQPPAVFNGLPKAP